MTSLSNRLRRIAAALAAAACLVSAAEAAPRVVGALAPHHSVAGAMIDRLYKRLASEDAAPARVVIIGPDHFGRARAGVVMGAPDWRTPAGLLLLSGDAAAARALSWAVPRQDDAVQRDHCVTEHIPHVLRFFPGAKVLCLLLRTSASDMELLRAHRVLTRLLRQEGGVVLLSMDLSHYKPRATSDAEDERTLAVLRGFHTGEIGGLDVDCRRGARLFLALMQTLGNGEAVLLERSNSDDYASRPSPRTTGHATCLYLPTAPPAP